MYKAITKLKSGWDKFALAVMPSSFHPNICGDSFVDLNTPKKSIDIVARWDKDAGYKVSERRFSEIFWTVSKCESSKQLLVTKDIHKVSDLMHAWSESKSKETDFKIVDMPLINGGAYVGNLKKKNEIHSL